MNECTYIVCGAVVLPSAIAAEMEDYLKVFFPPETEGQSAQSRWCAVPAGISRYITRFEVSPRMTELRRFLRTGGEPSSTSSFTEWLNFGLYLRWQCGVQCIERYQSLPRALVEAFTAHWVHRVEDMIKLYGAPWIQILEEKECGEVGPVKGEALEMTGEVCSIISFCVFVPAAAAAAEGESPPKLRRCSFDEMKELHRLLAVPAETDRAIMLG
jgi:hypothetical protein